MGNWEVQITRSQLPPRCMTFYLKMLFVILASVRDALRISYTRREIYVHPTMHYVARPDKAMVFQFQEVESYYAHIASCHGSRKKVTDEIDFKGVLSWHIKILKVFCHDIIR